MSQSERDRATSGNETQGPTQAKRLNVGEFILWGAQAYDVGNPDPYQMDLRPWEVTLWDKTGNDVDLELLLVEDGVTTDAATVSQDQVLIRVPPIHAVNVSWTGVTALSADVLVFPGVDIEATFTSIGGLVADATSAPP